MSIATSVHNNVRKDGHVDRHVDVQIASRRAIGEESGHGAQVGDAFVVVLANHKGGVTKTTSAANLGAMFAEAGRRVLLVDCDPQANLSEAFGWGEDRPGERLEDLLAHPAAMKRYVPPAALQADVSPRPAWHAQLRIIPATDALADAAADLPAIVGSGYENRLREVLDPLRDQFDVILLDTPPGRGNLSGMAVLAADGLLIPALAADLDVRGAGKLYDLVEGEIPGLRILGVLIAASDRRWQITRDAAARMAADQMRVLPVSVPRAVRVASAPRFRAPTAVLEPDSMIAHAYRQLARLLLAEVQR
jgi:chromosome partitioning protein